LLLYAVAAAAGLFVLHLLALWMERRGWIFYKHTRPSSTAVGNAFLEVQKLVEPSRQAQIEQRTGEKREEDEEGGK
jgi:hypothetical protein